MYSELNFPATTIHFHLYVYIPAGVYNIKEYTLQLFQNWICPVTMEEKEVDSAVSLELSLTLTLKLWLDTQILTNWVNWSHVWKKKKSLHERRLKWLSNKKRKWASIYENLTTCCNIS